MVKQKKIKTGKTNFYDLLKSEPKYTDAGCVPDTEDFVEVREQWESDIKEAFYEDVLQIYEEDERAIEEINELKEEVEELKKLVKAHIHRYGKVYSESD